MKILIIEDETELCQKYEKYAQSLSAFNTIETASSHEEARKKLASTVWDCLLCDQRLPDGQGIDLIKMAKHHQPEIKVAMITAHSEKDLAINSINLGVELFLEKPASKEQLLQAFQKLIEQARHSKRVHEVLEKFSLTNQTKEYLIGHFDITTREMEVIYAVLEIGDNSGIAQKLFISESTVKNHLANIFQKTQTSSKKELKQLVRDLNAQNER